MVSLVGQTLSHYQILERVGGGGMGVVYRARDLRLDRTVALKFLPASLTDDAVARGRFVREAKAASALQHNNICVIHDIEQTSDGGSFICMEFYEGETLRKKIDKNALSIEQASAIVAQIAQGLAEAHRHGIIHRDIKPENIFVTDRGVVKILDFGLAKLATATGLSRAGSTAGTPAYMSPEQTRGEELTSQTDIWSFGVVLYEMLAGHRPFVGDHPLALMYAINNEEPPPPSVLRHGIPEDLNTLCIRCLRKDVRERLADLSEVGVLSSPRVSAFRRTHGTLQRLPRSLRWGVAGLAAILIVALILLSVPARSISLVGTDVVVVADFENRTDNSLFSHSLTQGIKVSVRQSDIINMLPSDRIAEALALLKVPEGHPLDEKTALAVARREGARAVISPNISQLGSVYVLMCGIIDASTGETVQIVREEVDRVEAVMGGLDRLCQALRASVGESMTRISEAGLPLDQVTTSSLEALEIYSQSELYAAQGKYKEASLLLEKAVAIDSQFVMAISDLAYCYRKIGLDSLAALYHSRIPPLVHRTSERERLEILAIYYGPSFELDFPKAFGQLEQLTVRYPADAYAYATLGHLAMFAGDTRAALEANAKAVSMYPPYDRTCYNNSAFALALDGRAEEALGWFRKAKALRPDYPAIDHYMSRAYWMDEEFDSVWAVLERGMPQQDPAARNKSRVILVCLQYSQGKLRAAEQLATEGIRECRAQGKVADEAYLHLVLGEVAAVRGDLSRYRGELASVVRLSRSPHFDLALAGISLARRGNIAEAEEILRRVGAAESFDPSFLRYRRNFLELLRGEIALGRGHVQEGRKHFETVDKVQSGDPFYWIAQKGLADCAARASDTSAAALYVGVLTRRGEIVMGSLSSIRQAGVWIRWLWPETLLDLGEFYAAQGRVGQATASLDAALKYWNGADESDVVARRARTLHPAPKRDP